MKRGEGREEAERRGRTNVRKEEIPEEVEG